MYIRVVSIMATTSVQVAVLHIIHHLEIERIQRILKVYFKIARRHPLHRPRP